MEKMLKKIKVMVVILLILMISLIAFWGAFTKENGVWSNAVPDYKLGLDIGGIRELRFIPDNTEEDKYVYVDDAGNVKGEVWEKGEAITAEKEKESTETENKEDVAYKKETKKMKANEDSSLTKENFEETKKIIQKRLKNEDISEYNIRLDDVTGSIVVETKDENNSVDKARDLVANSGKFEIVDYQTGVVLMDNSDIKNTSVVVSSQSGYDTYLQIEFTKEGGEKLRDISNKYVEIKDENTTTDDTSKEDDEKNIKYVSVVFDGSKMITTYFGQEMTAGIMQIPVGKNTKEYDEYKKNYDSAKSISDVLNSGKLPIEYALEVDNFVEANFANYLNILIIIAVSAIACISVILIIKFKLKGVFASILGIGYIALLSIVVRYTNSTITASSLIAYCITIITNYLFMITYLKHYDKSYGESLKEFSIKLIPLLIIGVVFTLTGYYTVSSIGIAIFWGSILSILYNLVFTNIVVKNIERDV